MTDATNSAGTVIAVSPQEWVDGLERQSERLTTPFDNGEMVWRRWGDGERIVILFHGGHGSWSHWIRNIPVLAERYTVVAPDFPGCGDSSDAPDGYSGRILADIVATGLKLILKGDPRPAHLVGFSFGGVMSGLVAAHMEDRLTSLTLVGAGGLGLPPRGNPDPKGWRRLTDEAEIRETHRFNLSAMMIWDTNAIDDLALYVQDRNTRRSRMNSPAISNTDALLKVLPDVRTRLNGIWGEFDLRTEVRLKTCEPILRAIHPEVAFRIIPGAGHWVAYEAANRFNPLLMELLSLRET